MRSTSIGLAKKNRIKTGQVGRDQDRKGARCFLMINQLQWPAYIQLRQTVVISN